MKKIIILIAGFSPLLMGYILNMFVSQSNGTNLDMAYDFISIFFFLYWGVLGFALCNFNRKMTSTLIVYNFPAAIVLILILIQELINKAYWNNEWSTVTQMFYLPTLRLSYRVTPDFMHYMWQTYIVSFVLLLMISVLGGFLNSKCEVSEWIAKRINYKG